jgi:Zn-dependent protease with chaperone function
MPILLVFALIASCLPVEWPEPPFAPPREAALALSVSAVGLVLLIAFGLRTWVVRTLRRYPGRRIEVARTYGRVRRTLFFLNIATAASCVLGFGWGWLVQHELMVTWDGKQIAAPFAELAVPLPYFIILVSCWFIYYDAERALHRALHGRGRPFAPRFAYLLHNARQFALLVMLPVGLVVTQQTIGRFAPETTQSDVYRIASLAIVPLLLLFMPLLMKPLLGLKSMPAGPIRTRLEALAKRLNFRCTDFLLWPTHGAAANAMIAGLLPRVRYVVFTDRILEEFAPEELDAVFGHEVGHAKHAHIWLYAAFLTLSLLVLAALLLFVQQQLKASGVLDSPEYKARFAGYETWFLLVPVVVVVGYLFVVLGALSRRCERQADVFGCKAVSCNNPACTGHDETTTFPPGGNCLCPAGIRTFCRALDRVRDLNGLDRDPAPRSLGGLLKAGWTWFKHWTHGPIPRRTAYLMGLAERLGDERRFQRRLFVFKCALMLLLAAALVALGETVGWKSLFNELN